MADPSPRRATPKPTLTWAKAGGLDRRSAEFAAATQETARWDYRQIASKGLQPALMAFLQGVLDSGGPWMQRHQEQNVFRYLGRPSRCGTYVELLEEEVDAVRNPSTILKGGDVSPVELGFNAAGEACKVAYTVRIPASGRVLFIAIGVDAGVKTFYVTPTFKDRAAYKHKNLL